jgi:hypothetical protein
MTRSYDLALKPTSEGALAFNSYLVGNTPVSGTSLDAGKFEQIAVQVVCSAALTLDDTTTTIVVQDSEDGSTGWADIAGSGMTLDGSKDIQNIGWLRPEGVRRYLRLRAAVTGQNAAFGAFFVALGAKQREDDASSLTKAYSL